MRLFNCSHFFFLFYIFATYSQKFLVINCYLKVILEAPIGGVNRDDENAHEK